MENLETRNKIIETAAEQFMRFGIRSVTMDDIARQAGMSKKTIYQEFTDKNHLVFETFAASLERDKCMMETFPKLTDGIIEHLVGVSTYMRKRFADMNPLVMNELQRYFPQCWQLFEDFKQTHIVKEVVAVLEKGKEEGFFRPEINNEIIALLRMEQMMITFDPIKFPPSKYNMVDLQIEIFEHFLYGIFTDKGREAYLKQKNENQ
ncbi:TetR/AcrR family transcriptional regulator [Aquiflexum sp. TKW24L]|uniref:TetR/AcrR family transcriptional regulator n=1 Tax=Aquiflexum sp. TKW24L TaxID=2942212 RepID=UPI0032DFF678